ncbi:sugar transporter ERD6-like 7 isoform X2 [Rosa rugosa]|uniref:sugar transporter ERD6-like 7 isoform X2 n=1 Tax=Rosa rugosa TaxID=74645 RepID=UPI002B40C74B|nr:sugar transporter ERD6-like 7 isoform X2 [Rosa rugosa]
MSGSLLTFGAMIGAITIGPIADFIGRKGAMRLSSAFFVAGWLAIYFAESIWPLDSGRLANGYGMGAFSYVVHVFIAEIAPKNLRERLTAANQLMICAGVSVSYIIGIVVSWRALALIGLIPCAVIIFGLFFIPESPRWLTGKHKEFEVALQKLRGEDVDVSHEAAEIQDYIATLDHLPKAKMLDLFQRRYSRSVIVIAALYRNFKVNFHHPLPFQLNHCSIFYLKSDRSWVDGLLTIRGDQQGLFLCQQYF